MVRQEKEGILWHIAYPISDSDETLTGNNLTRPETMFGDMAVINPKDDRLKIYRSMH